MANFNLGNVVGLLKSQVAPTKKYVLWGKILNPSFPDIVEINYWDEVGQAWVPVTDPTHQYWLRPVISKDLATPPVSPTEGDRYLIPASATGDWSGKTNQVATRRAGAWSYTIPLDGYILTCHDQPNKLFDFRGDYPTGEWYTNNFNTVGDFIPTAEKGSYNGVATLDGLAKIPQSQLDPDNFGYNPSSPGNWPVGITKIRSALDYLILQSGAVVNSNIKQEVPQAAHGFSVGDILTVNGAGIYIKVTNPTTQKAVGIVTVIEDANNFTITMSGFVSGLSGLTAGTIYYVQATGVLGTIVTAMPYLIAKSATEGYTLTGGGDVKSLYDVLAVNNQSGGLSILFTGGTGIDTTATGASDVLNIGTDNADVINIGRVGATVNIQGTLAYQNVTNYQVTDKLITLNKGGSAASAAGAGIEFEEGGVVTGYISTTGARTGYDLKAPAVSGVATISLASLSTNRTYTLPNESGTVVLDTAAQTLSNKTIALGSNTVSGTKAQFNTSVTDGDFLFVGDIVAVSDGDKGDITVSSSGTVWTVDPTAISGKTTITTVDITNDYLLIWDATDSLLKKVAPTNLGLAGGGGDMLLGSTQTVTALKTFNSGTFALRNPANTFSYNILGSAIVADRNLTIPLLTAADVFVTEAFTQTLTNKTLNLASNTLSGTKAQFDAAASDGNFMWVGDAPTAHTLDSHSNVTITANSSGEILKWSGTAWINNTLAEAGISAVGHTHTLANVTDVTATAAEVNLLDLAGLTAGHVLRATGATTAAWGAVAGADVTGAALTKTDDTNVTLTLGGTPTTALLRAASITLGWTGTLAVSRGGIGVGTLTGVVIGNGTSAMSAVVGAASQLLRRNAGNTAYEFFTPTYLTANENITLSGDISGSGTTAITTTIGANKVTLGMMAQVATSTFLGRITAATGNVEALTTAQATSMLDLFSTTTTTKGLVPGSNNVGATFFLNANGVWAVPAGGGDMVLASVQNVTGEKTFDTSTLALFNPAKTFKYSVATSAIAAARTITLPILTGGDTFVFEAHAQTLTNKTIALGSNTISGTKAQFNSAVSDGDILYVGDAVTAVSIATANGVSGSSSGGTTPALTITLGAITPTTVNGLTLAAQAVGFTIAGGTTSKTLTISNTLTFSGTDSSTLNIGTGGTLGTAAFTASTAYLSSATNSTQDGYFTGVRLLEAGVSPTFYTRIVNGSDLTAARTLTISAGDTDKTLTISASATISGTNTGDQTITLTGDVTGSGSASFATSIANNVVTYAKIQQASAGFTIMAKATTAAGNYAELTAGADSILMRQASGNLVFSTIVTNQIGASQVTYAKIQNASAGYTIMAKAGTGAGAYAELAAAADTVLRRSGTGDIAFGTLVTNNIGDSQVTLAKIENIATGSFLGRTTAATGVVEVLTATQATAMLDLFATGSTTKGLVPGSNSVGATYYLNATGAWSIPAGGSGDMVLASAQNVTGEKVFDSTMLALYNPAKTFKYNFVTSAIAAQRDITVPLLTTADIFVFEAHTQTLTNKTLNLTNNTLSGTKAQFNAAVSDGDIVYLDSVDTITGVKTMSGLNVIKVAQNGFTLRNPANTFDYTIQTAAIAAARTITLPLLTGNDTMVTEAHTQTLTNKTITTIAGVAGTANNLWVATTTGNSSILTGQTSGTITVGGTAATGAITIGQSTGAQTLNLATGAASAVTKTINIGTGSGATSTTAINIGTGSTGTAVNITMGTSTLGTVAINTGNFTVIGNGTPITATIEKLNGGTNSVGYPLELVASTTGTPAIGIGAGLNFRVETAASVYKDAGAIELVATNITTSTEAFDIVFKAMTGGAAYTEKFRIKADGRLLLTTAPVTDAGFSTSQLLTRDSSGNIDAIAASGGGTTNFLRADGTWAAPSGGGTPGGATNELQKNNGASAFVGTKVFSSADGDLTLGDSGLAGGTRNLTPTGSATDVGLNIVAKGAGIISLVTTNYLSSSASYNYLIGTGSANVLERSSSSTNVVQSALKLRHLTSGVATINIGVSLEFEVETASTPNFEVGGVIAVVADVVTGGAEDFHMSLRTMSAGAAATERVRISHTAVNAVNGAVFKENNVAISSIGKHDFYLDASAFAPTVTAGCSALTKVEAATNDVNYWVLDFDQTTAENAFITLAMPREWDGGTITVFVYWTYATGTGGVGWGVKGRAASDDDAIDGAWGTEVVVTDTAIAAGDEHITAESSAITIGGTPIDNDMIYLNVRRAVENGGDTLTGDARLKGIKIVYTTNAAVSA